MTNIHMAIWSHIPPSSHEILCLDFASPHLSIFGRLFDFGNEFFLLLLELLSFTIELPLGLLQGALMLQSELDKTEVSWLRQSEAYLSQPLRGRLATPKCPLYNL